jgi:anti-sigma B factor antagonist
MKITTNEEDGIQIVSISGELDSLTVTAFEEDIKSLVKAGARRIVLDCAEMSFIDSAALGRLVAFLKEFRPLGGKLALAALRPSIKSTIEMIRLDRFIPVFSNASDAAAGIK